MLKKKVWGFVGGVRFCVRIGGSRRGGFFGGEPRDWLRVPRWCLRAEGGRFEKARQGLTEMGEKKKKKKERKKKKKTTLLKLYCECEPVTMR